MLFLERAYSRFCAISHGAEIAFLLAKYPTADAAHVAFHCQGSAKRLEFGKCLYLTAWS